MKTKERLLTRRQAAAQLELSAYEFDNLRTEGRINSVARPGRRRPAYRESDILALKTELAKATAAV